MEVVANNHFIWNGKEWMGGLRKGRVLVFLADYDQSTTSDNTVNKRAAKFIKINQVN